MKIVKFYSITVFAVIMSLCYIYQHTEIVKLNYKLNTRETRLAQLLDQKEALLYNIEKLENPTLLEERLQNTGDTDFAMPTKLRIADSGKPKKKLEMASNINKKSSIFDFLVPKAFAQVRTSK